MPRSVTNVGRGDAQVRRADEVNHYQRLGIATDAQPDVIRAAYRRRARAAHPDSTGSVDDEMAAINEAWFVLRDPQRRRRYDVVIDAAPSANARARVEVQARGAVRSVDRSMRLLVGIIRAAIVLAVVVGGLLVLIALAEGH